MLSSRFRDRSCERWTRAWSVSSHSSWIPSKHGRWKTAFCQQTWTKCETPSALLRWNFSLHYFALAGSCLPDTPSSWQDSSVEIRRLQWWSTVDEHDMEVARMLLAIYQSKRFRMSKSHFCICQPLNSCNVDSLEITPRETKTILLALTHTNPILIFTENGAEIWMVLATSPRVSELVSQLWCRVLTASVHLTRPCRLFCFSGLLLCSPLQNLVRTVTYF